MATINLDKKKESPEEVKERLKKISERVDKQFALLTKEIQRNKKLNTTRT